VATADQVKPASHASDRVAHAAMLLASPEQIVSRTPERLPEPQERCDQNIHVAGLDFLHRPGIEIHEFGKPFLRQPASRAFPAHVRAESSELGCLLLVKWHALLRRKSPNATTARWGVFWQGVCFTWRVGA